MSHECSGDRTYRENRRRSRKACSARRYASLSDALNSSLASQTVATAAAAVTSTSAEVPVCNAAWFEVAAGELLGVGHGERAQSEDKREEAERTHFELVRSGEVIVE